MLQAPKGDFSLVLRMFLSWDFFFFFVNCCAIFLLVCGIFGAGLFPAKAVLGGKP